MLGRVQVCQSVQWSQAQIRRLTEHLSQDRAKAAHKSLCCPKNTNFKSIRTDLSIEQITLGLAAASGG